MSLMEMNKQRATLITGQSGTGKTTLAKQFAGEDALIYYANEIEEKDWKSINSNIIIEEVHYKANVDVILNVLIYSNNIIVLTSDNEKDIPAKIKSMCRIRRAGTKKWGLENIRRMAPRSQEAKNIDKNIFDIIGDYLKNPNREEVLNDLKLIKPPDVQLMTHLAANVNVNKLIFIDGRVKRRWSSDYFYEMLAYSHNGRTFGRINYGKRGEYSKVPSTLRKLRIKPNQGYLLPQLLKDVEFEKWAVKRLRAEEKRAIGIKENTRKRYAQIIPDRTLKLDRWF